MKLFISDKKLWMESPKEDYMYSNFKYFTLSERVSEFSSIWLYTTNLYESIKL